MKVTVEQLGKMLPEQKDKLEMPAKRGGWRVQWVGFRWIVVGKADGTEPTEIVFESELEEG